MIRSLVKDIDLDTMYSMRRDGMNNQAIADALGVTSQTVYRHIGKQPPELRAVHRRASAVSVPQREEEIPACLAVANRTVMLRGTHLIYDLDLKDQTLQVVDDQGSGFRLALDELNDVISELRCIARRAENLKLENEMW